MKTQLDINVIYQYIRQKSYPPGTTVNEKRAIRRASTTNFKIERGVLMHKVCTKSDELHWTKVLESEEHREAAMVECHSSSIGGHTGGPKQCLHFIDFQLKKTRQKGGQDGG
ncbi:unnamed protein product, partial [Owenia fusiformis]